MTTPGTGPSAQRYALLATEREPYIVRARRCSALTIPSLFRSEGANGTTDQPVPWQSFGAYGVNNLTSKVTLSLFPAGLPFFLHKPAKAVEEDLKRMGLGEAELAEFKTELAKTLSLREGEIVDAIAEDGDNAVQSSGARHQIVGGNYGLQFYDDGKIRGVPFWRFVTKRDSQGNFIEHIILDVLSWETVPDDVRRLAMSAGYNDALTDEQGKPRKRTIEVYTHYRLTDSGMWEKHQEAFGLEVPDSRGKLTKDAMDFHHLGWVWMEGEDYARSFCEDYEGDLQTLDGLYQIIQMGAAAMARFVQLVKPGGVTNKKALAEAVNGAILTGNADDVTTVQADKSRDFQFVMSVIQSIEQRLARAFLLNSAVQRGGERVTAEEIRYVARELEDVLGGVYANQVVTWQAPYARLKVAALERSKRITRVPARAVKLQIITGSTALGRAAKVQTIRQFCGDLLAILGPQAAQAYFKANGLIMSLAAAYQLDVDAWVKSPDEIQADQQQQAQGAMGAQLIPEVARQGGQFLTQTTTANIKAAAQQAQQTPEQVPQ